MTTDTITLLVFLAPWPLWMVWELVLLWRRAHQHPGPKTISMVAKDRGWHLSSVVYTYCGLATHYWWPSKTWATVPGSVAFWLITAGLLASDVALWRSDRSAWPAWLRRVRTPALVMAFGALAGKVLFPQAE